jgi:hypothetical protein
MCRRPSKNVPCLCHDFISYHWHMWNTGYSFPIMVARTAPIQSHWWSHQIVSLDTDDLYDHCMLNNIRQSEVYLYSHPPELDSKVSVRIYINLCLILSYDCILVVTSCWALNCESCKSQPKKILLMTDSQSGAADRSWVGSWIPK